MLYLSGYLDEFEQKEHEYVKQKCSDFVSFYKEVFDTDLCSLSKSEDPVYTFNYLKAFLFNKNKGNLYYCLSEIGCDPLEFEKNLIFSVCITMCKGKDNSRTLVEMMEKQKVFNDVIFGYDGWFYIDSDFDKIKCKPAMREFKDDPVISKKVEELKEKGTLDSACHELSALLIKNNPSYKAITGISTKGLGDSFYHSVVVDENDMIIDIPNNIIMPRDEYFSLSTFKPISEVTYDEYVELDKTCEKHDESGTLYPLLRIALYKERTTNKQV